ncbi:kinase-like domain-containing protein [Mycena leptocephala]|nr:kinase-like domain-containing protein [Mycena leptocephala]
MQELLPSRNEAESKSCLPLLSPLSSDIGSPISVHNSGQPSRDVSARLFDLISHPSTYKQFLSCRDTDAQTLLDLLQDLLDSDLPLSRRPQVAKALRRLAGASGLHPRCFALTGLQKTEQQMGGGAFGDVWKGLVGGQSICVKIMRIFQDDDIQDVLKEFGREALIWRQLSHPNLLPFFGLYNVDNKPCLVSPWMRNGNIMEFLRKEPVNTNRLSLILDVALGLEYLHEQNVVHGDLKGANILVGPSRRACIADFGLSSVVDAMTLRFSHSTASTRQGGTHRYHAPELFKVKQRHCGSDVYAFACVAMRYARILTGQRLFHDLNDIEVMFHIVNGIRPPRPMSCSNSLWELLQNCWVGDTEIRPTAPQIVKRLEGPSIRATTTSSTTDWDDKFTSEFRRSLRTQPLLPSVSRLKGYSSAMVSSNSQLLSDIVSSLSSNRFLGAGTAGQVPV